MIDLDRLVAETEDVPALPASASQLASLLTNEHWELEDIVRAVKLDPSLSARLLRTANSALSGGACRTGTLDQAVMRVGAGSVLTLALSGAVRGQLETSLPCFGLTDGELWRHSVAAAFAVESARRFIRPGPPPEAFATALLHEIGIVILATQMTSELLEQLRRARENDGHDLIDAELETLGVHHGEIGGMIARHWELPDAMAEGIAFHHEPNAAPSEAGRLIAEFVALGDAVASAVGYGTGATHTAIAPPYALIGVDEETFAKVVEATEADLADVFDRYE